MPGLRNSAVAPGRRSLRALAALLACTLAAVSFDATPAFAADRFPGARSVRGKVVVQHTAPALRPRLEDAIDDRGKMYADGCQLFFEDIEPKFCVYGDPESDISVMLLGDSTAMHYFPALEAIAIERGWRLIGMTKAGCSLARFTRISRTHEREYTECYEWQDRIFDLIAEQQPDMVIMAGMAKIGTWVDGEPLKAEEAAPVIEEAWADAFREVKQLGAKVVLMASGPVPPRDIPTCVAANRDRLGRCAMNRQEVLGYDHTDVRAANRVNGVEIVNVRGVLCNDTKCPAVIGNVLVYRQTFHFTATYAKTMTDRIDGMLPDP